jgi:hypothetical protein
MNGNNNQTVKSNDFPEAPASWNTRYIDPNGFECQITLRGDTGTELLEKATLAITYLLKNGCVPYVYRSPMVRKDSSTNGVQDTKKEDANGNGKNDNDGNPAWCPIHQCEMKRWDKNGRVWYSHKVDDKWCSGK